MLPQLEKIDNNFCIYCNSLSIDGYTHKNCLNNCSIKRYLSLYTYSIKARNYIYKLKYASDIKIQNLFFLEFSIFIYKYSNSSCILVPIPMHPFKKIKKGFNHSENIAVFLNKSLNLIVEKNLVFKIRSTLPQSKLNMNERKINSKGIYISNYNSQMNHKIIFLIDDIGTTGTTLLSCANAIKEKNPTVTIWAFTIFR